MSVIYRGKDYENKKFGRLTITGLTRKNGLLAFKCKCDCGKEKDIRCTNVVTGAVRSCGCLFMEGKKAHGKKIGFLNRKEMFCRICGNKHYAKGLCKNCYERDRRNGHYLTA